MARLITSGGELRDHITTDINSPDGWSAGAVATTTETTNYRSGDSAFACAGTAASTSFRAWSYTAPALASNLYARVYLRVSALPSATAKVVAFVTSADAALVSVRLNADGTFALWNDAGAAQIGANTGTVLQVDSWYRILLRLNIGSGAIDQAELRVIPDSPYDVEETVSGTALTISDTHSARLRAGWIDAPGVTSTMLLDDVAVNDSTGTTKQNTWPTNGSVLLMLPDPGTAVNTNWTPCSGAAPDPTTFYDYLNNRPPIGLADHATAGHTGATAHQARCAASTLQSFNLQTSPLIDRGVQTVLEIPTTGTTDTVTSYFGDVTARTMRAQSFRFGLGVTLDKVGAAVWKIGSPTDNVIIEVQSDASGLPSGTVLGTATIPGSTAALGENGAAGRGFKARMDHPVDIAAGTMYWLVIRRSGALDATNYYGLRPFSATGLDAIPAWAPAVYDGSSWLQSGTNWNAAEYGVYATIAQPVAAQRVIQPIICHGQATTGTKVGSIQASTPTIGQLTFNYGNAGAAAGTYPTGWWWTRGTVLYDRTNTSMDLRAVLTTGASASTGTKLISFMGLHIETEVQLQGWMRWQKSADSTIWWGKRASQDTDVELAGGTVLSVDALSWIMYPDPQITAGQDFPATTVAVQDGGGFPTGHVAA